MTGERRPSPDLQVRQALVLAKRDGMPFEDAWKLARDGHVCDSYASARGSKPAPAQQALEGPPNLRASEGQRRCAGCRFVTGAGDGGNARCTLYSRDVFAGVLWPHRTGDRHQWQEAIDGTAREWAASYLGVPTPVAAFLEVMAEVMRRRAGTAQAGDGLTRGHIAA